MAKTWISDPKEYEAMGAKEQSAYRCAVDAAAQAEGVRVEGIDRQMVNPRAWVLLEPRGVLWDWHRILYRIAKPKPMEVWAWVNEDGNICHGHFYSQAACEQDYYGHAGRAVCFVEKGG